MEQLQPKSNDLIFFVNGKKVVENNADPETTLLQYLRYNLRLTGTKLGCGEGGCGACTVMVSRYDHAQKKIIHYSMNACLAPLCAMHGLAITTVEGVGSVKAGLHPVQERIAKSHGSQCGFCTPGIVMSMYTLLRNNPLPTAQCMEKAFEGNLCRCTGYRPILDGFKTFTKEYCGMGENCCRNRNNSNNNNNNNPVNETGSSLSDPSEFLPLDPSQDPIFPPELQNSPHLDKESLVFCGERVVWHRPTTLPELLNLKSQYPDAKLVIGNTEVGIEVKLKNMKYPVIIAPTHIPELNSIAHTDRGVRFGASVTLTSIDEELKGAVKEYPEHQTRIFTAVIEMLRWFAGYQIRNVAAIGGNIITASPISDLNPLLLAAGAILEVQSNEHGKRHIKMDDKFFLGYRKTAVNPEEVLISVLLPFTVKDEYFYGYKQAYRREDDIATVNAGIRVQFEENTNVIKEMAFGYGGMAPITVMATKTATSVVGKKWEDNLVPLVCQLLADDLPLAPGSPGGMVEYRRTLTTSFFFKFYLTVLMQLQTRHIITKNKVPSYFQSATPVFQRDPSRSTQVYQEVAPGQLTEDSVGRPYPHTSGIKQATGEAVYVDDMPQFTNELYMAFVYSSKAHANIIDINATEALSMPGVRDFITHEDVPGPNLWGCAIHDEEVFASSTVLCQGQIIGAVVAETQVQAQRAAKCVKVQYEELEPIITIQVDSSMYSKIEESPEVRQPLYLVTGVFLNCPAGLKYNGDSFVDGVKQSVQDRKKKGMSDRRNRYIHYCFWAHSLKDAIKAGSFFTFGHSINCGNVDAAFQQADNVVEGECHIGGQEHFYLETQASVAVPKGEDGELEMFVSTQNPTETQMVVAANLVVPASHVVVRVKRIGGGFGGKETRNCSYSIPVAIAANKLGCPVRVSLDRDEDMYSSGGRHPFYAKYKVGFTDKGKLVAVEMDLYSNAGISLDLSAAVMDRALFHCENSYRVPNFRVRGHICRTNIPSNTAFRGFGGPQGMMVAEHCMMDVAVTLGISPMQVREINLYYEGDTTHFCQPLYKCMIRRCWEECVRQSDFNRRKKDVDIFNSENRWKKRGITMVPVKFGIAFTAPFLNQAGALVHIYHDGSVLLTHSGVEMGQGLHTKMIQVASRVLHIPTSKIHISETGTNLVPNTSPTAASSSSDLNGMAIVNACQTLLERLEPVMRENPKGSWEDWVKEAYFKRISLSTTGFYKTPVSGFDFQSGTGSPFNYFTYGTACSEVEIDCLTGDHQVLRTDIVMDVGISLNPAIDIGQVEGAFVQGYGLFMMEQLKVSPKGFQFTRGPGNYKIPGFGDIPVEFNVSLLKGSVNERAVYSSKAIGEPPFFLASSVFFAVKEAILSARADAGHDGNFRLDSPATPERVRMSCEDQFTEMFPSAEEGTYTPWFVDL